MLIDDEPLFPGAGLPTGPTPPSPPSSGSPMSAGPPWGPLPLPPLRPPASVVAPSAAVPDTGSAAGPASPRPARSRRLFAGAVVVIVAAWFAGLLGAVVGNHLSARNDNPPGRPSTLGIVTAAPRTDALPQLDVEKVADQVGASVVSVQVVVSSSKGVGESIGTGIIITADGEILTNAHVVHGAATANVRFPGETEPRKAKVLAFDTDRDLALLRVDATGLDAVTFAAPGDVHIGDQVLAIGYALDLEGDPSVTLGIVSAVNRTLATGTTALKGLVQTDAAISSGNSGGPLLNALGQVVGINTLVAVAPDGTAANNVGFAIGSGELVPEIAALRKQATGTTIASGFMGVQLGARIDGGSGALITDVASGSPAATAGVDKGDVIVGVDGVAVAGEAALVAMLRDYQPGAVVTLSITRSGEPVDVSLTLGTRPPSTTTR